MGAGRGVLASFNRTAQMTGPSIGGLVGKLAAAGAAAFTLHKAISAVADSLQRLDRIGKFSDEVGITVNQMRGLQLGAELSGTKVETMEKGLQRLVRRLGEAKMGLGQGVTGLKQLGLEASELTRIPTFEALKKVSQAIKDQKTPAEQAAAAYSLFGRQGLEMLTFLKQGAAGMDEGVQKALELGGSMSRIDLAQVELANDAITELKFGLKSVFDQAAIHLAPIVMAIAKNLTAMGVNGKSASEFIVSGLEFVAKAIALGADTVDAFRIAWLFLKKIALEAIAIQIEALAAMAKALQEVINKIPGVTKVSFGDDLTKQAATLRASAAATGVELNKALVGKSAGEKVSAFFEKVRADSRTAAEEMAKNAKNGTKAMIEGLFKATEAAAKLAESLEFDVRTFGLSSTEKQILKLREQGAPKDVLERATNASKILESKNRLKVEGDALRTTGKSVTEQFLNPLEKFRKEQDKLQKLVGAGAISRETFGRAESKLREDTLEKLLPKEEQKVAAAGPTAALQQGSAEAFSAIFGAQRQDTAQQQQLKANQLTAKNTTTMSGKLDAIRDEIRNNATQTVESF